MLANSSRNYREQRFKSLTSESPNPVHIYSAIALAKTGLHFIGVVKMGHALYPKQFLREIVCPLPSSSRLVLTTTVDDVDLVAIGYKYNRRKVLFFIATSGAADILYGIPYAKVG